MASDGPSPEERDADRTGDVNLVAFRRRARHGQQLVATRRTRATRHLLSFIRSAGWWPAGWRSGDGVIHQPRRHHRTIAVEPRVQGRGIGRLVDAVSGRPGRIPHPAGQEASTRRRWRSTCAPGSGWARAGRLSSRRARVVGVARAARASGRPGPRIARGSSSAMRDVRGAAPAERRPLPRSGRRARPARVSPAMPSASVSGRWRTQTAPADDADVLVLLASPTLDCTARRPRRTRCRRTTGDW